MVPPVTFTQALIQYFVPTTLGTVVICVHSPARKVMVEDGLVHRFVTIIGHHQPDGRSYASGIVSPVKKPGSPPPTAASYVLASSNCGLRAFTAELFAW